MTGRQSGASARLPTTKRRPQARQHSPGSSQTTTSELEPTSETQTQAQTVHDKQSETLPPPLPQTTYWLRGSWRPVFDSADADEHWVAQWSAWVASPTGQLEPESTHSLTDPSPGRLVTSPGANTDPESLIQRALACVRDWYACYGQGLERIQVAKTCDTVAIQESWVACDQLVRELAQLLNALRPWQALAALLRLSLDQLVEKRRELESVTSLYGSASSVSMETSSTTDASSASARQGHQPLPETRSLPDHKHWSLPGDARSEQALDMAWENDMRESRRTRAQLRLMQTLLDMARQAKDAEQQGEVIETAPPQHRRRRRHLP
jgi:hypothetical protein